MLATESKHFDLEIKIKRKRLNRKVSTSTCRDYAVMDSCFPASDKNKLHSQAGEGQICDVFHLTFGCLCFAMLTEIQQLLPRPCSSHPARAGAATLLHGQWGHCGTWGLLFP